MSRRRLSLTWSTALLTLCLSAVPAAGATLDDPVEQWMPSSDGASWTYEWSNTAYAPKPTKERYTLKSREGSAFRLAWTTEGLGNPEGTVASAGEVDYKRTDGGLVNLNWASTPPPSQFPILCASVAQCPNSLAGSHYLFIWGNRSPVLLEPLVKGSRWNSLGGANNDVSSASRYIGRQRVATAAFPAGVTASVVESDVTQAGAVGDPYGSGVRTVWWVRGVGPVKVRFRHAGGETSEALLSATNLKPTAAPSDVNYLPLNRGDKLRYRWRNSKHMRTPSVQDFTVAEVVNNTARVDVKQVSGPISISGSYVLATRLSGVTNLSGVTRTATRSVLPRLGPRALPADRRRRFSSPFDFMAYGFNPIVSSYAKAGQFWESRTSSRDYKVFGVTGRSKVLGIQKVRTPRGTLRALAVESTFTQKGFPFGSGRRTSWFAPGKGLVKLVFRHRDGSVSTVERLR